MKTTMDSIKQMVDVNTIVGDAVETVEGTVIIPISRLPSALHQGGEYQMQEEATKAARVVGKCPLLGEPVPGFRSAGGFHGGGQEHIKLMPANSSGMIERIIEMSHR